MSTFNQILNQTAIEVLSPKQQVAISQMQYQLLENSLIQVRQGITKLQEIIEVQEMAFNPCIEVRDKLAEKKAMEQRIWVEIQMRGIRPQLAGAYASQDATQKLADFLEL
jgi:hypothetical protein